MKTNHFFKAAILLIAATLAGCSNDNIADEMTTPQEETQGMTEFAVAENPVETTGEPSNAPGPRRTSGEYTGSSVKFYWTSGDQLWINDGSSLKASSRTNIPATGGKETTAKFWFDGTYTATTYPVRYTGNGNTAGDKVTIKAAQAQQNPNDGSHIGADGDCGTGTATRGADGRYNFTLAHKASYLTFMPYTTQSIISNAVITQIKVTADRPITGTYNFDDSGLDTSAPTATSNSITLTLNGNSSTSGFAIPSAPNPAANAAIMVLAPGTYSTFLVEYTLYDAASNISGHIIKEYTNLTFTAGKNKKVAADLHVPVYGFHEYYTWDAAAGQHYWAGYESVQPAVNNTYNDNWPKTSTDPRWYNTMNIPTTATRSAANAPNVNQAMWLAQHGLPHWDGELLWAMNGILHKGVMWFKKQSFIAADNGKTIEELKAAAPDGVDYTTSGKLTYYNNLFNQYRPSSISNYFYLPTSGRYNNGNCEEVGFVGRYWTSSAGGNEETDAYYLCLTAGTVIVAFDNRIFGQRILAVE